MSENERNVHHLIARRRSSYAFDTKPLSRTQIRVLFEAAQWAPSSFNEQPWRFLIATKDDSEAYDRLANLMAQWNREFASRAPLIGLTAAKLSFEKNGKPNPHAVHDVGLASENLALQAVALDLQMYMVAGYDAEGAAKLIPSDGNWIPVAMFAIGYPGRIEDLPERYQRGEAKERTRLPLGEIVFEGEWGRAAREL